MRREYLAKACQDIAKYIEWYNNERGHSSIADKTPEQFYMSVLPTMKKAAQDAVPSVPRVLQVDNITPISNHPNVLI